MMGPIRCRWKEWPMDERDLKLRDLTYDLEQKRKLLWDNAAACYLRD